jgi:hypothetical protein
MPDGTFLPENFVRVDEFIKMTVTSLGYKLENGADYWAEPFISAALEENLIDEDEFSDYTGYITRQEAAKIIVRAVMLVETAPGSSLHNYIRSVIADYPEIGDVYKQYVIDAYAIGLLTGTPDRKFNPLSNLKRCEASVIILRGLDPEERISTKPDDSEMLVLNDFYDNSYDVYPGENPETFETAVALNNSISKSKGYAAMIYNPFEEIISVSFVANEEAFNKDVPDFQGVFTIDTVLNVDHPYTLLICKPEEFKELHRDVIVVAFKYLFGNDTEKALLEFDKYIELSMDGGPSKEETFYFNNRKTLFYIVENELKFTLWIYNKEN